MASNEEMKADLDSLTAMAKRLGLKGSELTDYIHQHMTKLGYKSKRAYFKDETKTGSGGSGFSLFGGSKSNDDDDDE